MSTSHKLWCLIEGDETLLLVTAPSNISIFELKKLIKAERENTPFLKGSMRRASFSGKHVNVGLSGIIDAIQARRYRFNTEDQQPLHVFTKISDVWPQPPSDDPAHLLVYVTLPSNIVSPTAPQYGSPMLSHLVDYFWLEEIYSKIWKKKELERALFREVKVTQAHYTELQDRLNEQLPGRNSPEYDGKMHDVRSIKLGVLRSIPEKDFSPRHPDTNEDRVDDDDDLEASNEDASQMDVDGPETSNKDGPGINSFFPFTLRFLDLTILDLKNVPQRLPSPLFLRQEYDDISALIEHEPQSKHGSVVVSGQPGTGKTAYLHLRVIQSMIEGRPFLYQAQDGTVYYVNEKGVQPIEFWSSNEYIVAFVDGDRNEPDYMLLREGVQIILASAPKGARAKWIKQTGFARTVATKLWTPRELFIAGIFLHPFDVSLSLLRESTLYFGYNPRLCFISARSGNVLHAMKVEVASRIASIDFKQGNMLQLIDSARTGNSTVSRSIFEISPINESRHLGECGFGIVSRWAFDRSMETYEAQGPHAATTFYRHISISRTPDAVSLWGYLFERLVLNCLDRIDAAGRKFPICGLTSPEEMTWTYCGPTPRSNFLHKSDFIDEITKAVQKNKPLHLVSSSPKFTAIGSILYVPNEALTCIQTTVSTNHGIPVSGLQRIQNWLEHGTLLAHLRPSADRPWRFIFIVPPGEASTFELQQLKGDTALGEWAGKVNQFVLGLDVLGKGTE